MTRTRIRNRLFLGCLASAVNSLAAAQTQGLQTETPPPEQTYCAAPAFHALDFMVGDWLIYEHGELMATGHVEKRQRGCWLWSQEQWINDKYRRPGQAFRFQSAALYAYSNNEWKMMAVDIMGGAFVLRGQQRSDGAMELLATEPRKGVFIKGIYEKLPNGDVRATGFTSPDGRESWKQMFEYIYKRIN
jgi:hypothetical protein